MHVHVSVLLESINLLAMYADFSRKDGGICPKCHLILDPPLTMSNHIDKAIPIIIFLLVKITTRLWVGGLLYTGKSTVASALHKIKHEGVVERLI